jgi:hypothetical protein
VYKDDHNWDLLLSPHSCNVQVLYFSKMLRCMEALNFRHIVEQQLPA